MCIIFKSVVLFEGFLQFRVYWRMIPTPWGWNFGATERFERDWGGIMNLQFALDFRNCVKLKRLLAWWSERVDPHSSKCCENVATASDQVIWRIAASWFFRFIRETARWRLAAHVWGFEPVCAQGGDMERKKLPFARRWASPPAVQGQICLQI